MLKIVVPLTEAYDEATGKFVTSESFVLELEHSLASLSKWESKFVKPFLEQGEKTNEEMIGYIKAMTLTPDVPEEVYLSLSIENITMINEYINSPMTATTIHERGPKSVNNEIITAEIIYYWMVALSIPFECEHWHLNRLITLVRVCNLKNKPAEQMSPSDIASQQRRLNEQRRAQLGTRG